MAQQTIGLGTVADDGTGDDLRTAGGKINDNFTELYAADAAIAETIDDRVATLLTEGTNITLTYDDGAGTLTIDAAATSGDITDFNEAVDDRVGALIDAGVGISVSYDDGAGTLTISNTGASALLTPVTPVFNFTDDGEARFYADVAMTLTQQGTSGTGSVAYEKSTNAAPSTFSSTTSPISLEAGAWLKVTASSVTDLYAVALKRTA